MGDLQIKYVHHQLTSSMARKLKLETLDREKNMVIALMGLRNSRWMSVGKAAWDMNVPQESLRRQWKGGMSHVEAWEKQQKLTKPEEKVLGNWITRLTAIGHPERHEFIREMAEEIRNKWAGENQPHLSIVFRWANPGFNNLLGTLVWKRWFRVLLRSLVLRHLQRGCRKFLDALEACLQEYQIEWQNVYNMHETGKLLDTLNWF